jgi:hypothetical protein
MTDIEQAEKIRDQKGSCEGLGCKTCPIRVGCDMLLVANSKAAEIHWNEPNPAYVELAESYLLEKKYTPEV